MVETRNFIGRVLTMVYNTQNHWVSGPSSFPMFWKLDLFPSSGEGKETPTVLVPLERTNLSHTYSAGALRIS
jgi:hypothetical protein